MRGEVAGSFGASSDGLNGVDAPPGGWVAAMRARIPRVLLLDLLRSRPGATVTEVARAVGSHHSTAAYHLGRLQREGLVVLQRHRGRVHCFLAGASPPEARARVVAARSAHAALVLARVAARPLRLGEVSEGLPLTKAAVYWHLCRLAALGLVAIEGPPKARRYRLPAPPAPLAAPAPAVPLGARA